MNLMTEAQHQSALIQWSRHPLVRKKYPELELLYHIPNGGSRNAIEAKHLKEQGVRSGVPDLHLPVPRGGYHGLWIELKVENKSKAKVSRNQSWWIGKLLEQGYMVAVCYGWESARELIEQYLGLEA